MGKVIRTIEGNIPFLNRPPSWCKIELSVWRFYLVKRTNILRDVSSVCQLYVKICTDIAFNKFIGTIAASFLSIGNGTGIFQFEQFTIRADDLLFLPAGSVGCAPDALWGIFGIKKRSIYSLKKRNLIQLKTKMQKYDDSFNLTLL